MVVGALEWLVTLAMLVAERRAGGEPWLRLVIILGAVGAVALGSAVLLSTPRAARHFAGAGDPEPPAGIPGCKVLPHAVTYGGGQDAESGLGLRHVEE